MADKKILTPTEHWKQCVEEFISFGGTADNVMQREGEFGLGLFPIDPAKPAELHVPDQLLVATDNVELRDGSIVLKDSSSYPPGFGDWYQRFQAHYSWGAEAKDSIRTFEEGLKSLPERTQNLLRSLGIANIEGRYPEAKKEQDIFNRFLTTRRIKRNEQTWLMPMIELVNHSPRKPSWGMNENGITVKGTFDGEILVRYSVADPLRRLFQYGFNCREPHGFSIRTQIKHRDNKIVVKGMVNYAPLRLPTMHVNGNEIIFDSTMLGSMDQPRAPRSIFRKALAHIEGVNPDEIFDQIAHRNRLALVQLLREIASLEGRAVQMIREACWDQLISIGFHIGSREIPEEWDQAAT